MDSYPTFQTFYIKGNFETEISGIGFEILSSLLPDTEKTLLFLVLNDDRIE